MLCLCESEYKRLQDLVSAERGNRKRVREKEKKREREKERKRERMKEKKREREKERKRDIERERERESERDTENEAHSCRKPDRHIVYINTFRYRHIDRRIHGHLYL